MSAQADTGAQMVILGVNQLKQLGVDEGELVAAKLIINTADSGRPKNKGTVMLKITARYYRGVEYCSRQQGYVMDGATRLFLNHDTLEQLGCCSSKFPEVGSVTEVTDEIEEITSNQPLHQCDCP